MKEIFYKILNMGLWGNITLPEGSFINNKEADDIIEAGRLQAVSGIITDGIHDGKIRLGENQSIRCVQLKLTIDRQNKKIENLGNRIIEDLGNTGFKAEIFKGISVGKWYRNPHSRSFGDIDVVVNEGFEKIENLLQGKGIKYNIEHGDIVCSVNGISVEFHRYREFTYNPFTDKKLKSLLREYPNSNELYLACIMLHIRRHVITYGIGMKQICDVAVMLRYAELDMNMLCKFIKELNMEKFAAALFGFIKRRFGEEVKVYPIKPDCGSNSLFLEDIVWNDGYLLKKQREKHNSLKSSLTRICGNTWFWLKRSVRMMRIIPDESMFFIPYMIKRRLF